MKRGEILSCGHESMLPKELIPAYVPEAFCPTCNGGMWTARKPENVKADA